MSHLKSVTLILGIFACSLGHGQSTDTSYRKFTALSAYFQGNWKGKGEFSNGKKIEATVRFLYDSIHNCLIYYHDDVAPSSWKLFAVWNLSKADNGIVALYNDSFGRGRVLSAAEWTENNINLERKYTKGTLPVSERFRFDVIDSTHYKMTWENKKGGDNWQVGDYLVFERL